MTAEQIAEIRARCEAATPGPWKYVFREDLCQPHEVNPKGADFKYAFDSEENAKFIARAREDIPALLDALEEEISRRYQAESNYDQWVKQARELEADRDRWKARAEATERAIKTEHNSPCSSCVSFEKCTYICKSCFPLTDPCMYQFDEARFSGEDKP